MIRALAEALENNRPLCMIGSPAQQWRAFKSTERYMWRSV